MHPVHRTSHGLTDEARAILERGRYAVLGTRNADGSVHLVPVMYGVDGARILIETGLATRKARNLAAHPHATVLVLDPAAHDEAWVSGSGPVAIITGTPSVPLGRKLRSRYLTPAGEEQLGTAMARYDNSVVVITPDHWLSWDNVAYNAALAADAVDFTQADDWFR